DRRHERVGLGAPDTQHPRRRRMGQVPEPQADGRRDQRAAGGPACRRSQRQAQVQDRDGPASRRRHVPAYEGEGGVGSVISYQSSATGNQKSEITTLITDNWSLITDLRSGAINDANQNNAGRRRRNPPPRTPQA